MHGPRTSTICASTPTFRRAGLVCALTAGLLLTGCSSPAHRIAKHRDLFDSFPADVQEKLSQGEVDIGYTTDMAYLALGRPDKSFIRKTVDGDRTVWVYSQYTTAPHRYRAHDYTCHRRCKRKHHHHYRRETEWVEEPYLTLVFGDAKIISIDAFNERGADARTLP